MTISTAEAAYFSSHVYGDMAGAPPLEKGSIVPLGDRIFEIVEVESNGLGYQGAIYRDQKSGELVVAHRGTELTVAQQAPLDLGADLGMVVAQANIQMPAAMRLVEEAQRIATRQAEVTGNPAPITITGHSLGGYLTQHTCAKSGLPGETFNAYGAAGLHGAVEGRAVGNVVNHMRATDFVSAGNAHVGDVRVYATPDDVAMLTRSGLPARAQGSGEFMFDVGRNLGSHSMSNFHPPGTSIMSAANRANYVAHHGDIDALRDDVRSTRETATYVSRSTQDLTRLRMGQVDGLGDLLARPLPKVPDYLQRDAVNATTVPREATLRVVADVADVVPRMQGRQIEVQAHVLGVATTTTLIGGGAAVSRARELAGDAEALAHGAMGRTRQGMERVIEAGARALDVAPGMGKIADDARARRIASERETSEAVSEARRDAHDDSGQITAGATRLARSVAGAAAGLGRDAREGFNEIGQRAAAFFERSADMTAAQRENMTRSATNPRLAEGRDGIHPRALAHPGHPHHDLFERVHMQLRETEVDRGIKPGPHTAQLAGALTVACLAQGIKRVDRVEFNDTGTFARVVDVHPLRDETGLNRRSLNVPTAEGSRQSLLDNGDRAIESAREWQLKTESPAQIQTQDQTAARAHMR